MDEEGAPASQVVRLPPTSVGASSGSMDNEWIADIGASTYGCVGDDERSGLMTMLDMGSWVLSYTPQVNDSIPGIPMRSVGCEEVGGSRAHGIESTWDGYGETGKLPPVQTTESGVGRERASYTLWPNPPQQRSAGRNREEDKDRRSGPRGAREGAMRGYRRDMATLGSGAILVEDGGINVERPIGRKDNIEVAFEMACRVTTELSLEETLSIPRIRLIL